MNDLDFALLNDFQRGFPLCERPFARIAADLGASERDVLGRLEALVAGGQISRVGAVFAPQAIGASTLAALSVAPERLEEVADRISRYPQVNHNYEREHDLNLWFVATAGDDAELAAVLARIGAEAGCGALLVLPLVQEFRIDLGFDLLSGPRPVASTRASTLARSRPCTMQNRL